MMNVQIVRRTMHLWKKRCRRERLIFLFAIVGFLSSACGGKSGGVPPGAAARPPALTSIPEIDSQNGVASFTLQAAFTTQGRPGFFWNQQQVAPTIRVVPGDTIRIHFINNLPEFCAVGVQSDGNLHFHGLTTSPNAPGDDAITTNAAPGSATDYTIAIDPDQPPGLYWYHPHPHGITAWEAGNGMAGAIIIDGIAAEVPQTAGIRERLIILTDIPTGASLADSELSVLRRSPQSNASQGAGCAPEINATPMINGAPLASIGIRPGETEFFRVLNASNHRHFDLAIDGQQITLAAQDGVPIQAYPGAPQSITVSDIVIPPAGRAEFLVTGANHPTSLITQCYQTGPAGYANPTAVLAMLYDDGAAPQAAPRVPTLALRRSRWYRVALPAPAAAHTIRFEETGGGFNLNGIAYDPSAPPSIVSRSGTVEEWTLENDSDEVHVFHIHQVHFVVESIDGVTQANPHWLDTVDVPPQRDNGSGAPTPSTMKVLIDFRDPVVRGTFLYHCHILTHEDNGMMAKIQVL